MPLQLKKNLNKKTHTTCHLSHFFTPQNIGCVYHFAIHINLPWTVPRKRLAWHNTRSGSWCPLSKGILGSWDLGSSSPKSWLHAKYLGNASDPVLCICHIQDLRNSRHYNQTYCTNMKNKNLKTTFGQKHTLSLLSNAEIWGCALVTTSVTWIFGRSASIVLMKHSFSVITKFLFVSRLSTETICTMSRESCSIVVYVQYCAQWPIEWGES